MVHRCCISSCGMNVRVAEAKGLSYHRFPNKEPLRDQWIQAIIPHLDKPEIFKVVPKYTRICSRHFRKKDYSVDIKKRARLNINAVPTVFPRKNTPLVVPNVLSSSPRGTKIKGIPVSTISGSNELNNSGASTPTFTAVSHSLLTTLSSEELSVASKNSPVVTTVTWTITNNGEDGTTTTTTLDTSSLPREFLIESATLTDDQLTLTVLDPESSLSVGVSQDESVSAGDQDVSYTNDDSNDAPYKKRKRRKWNRSAFDRPAKGKKKTSYEDSNVDGVGEALAEISLSNLLVINSSVSQRQEESCDHERRSLLDMKNVRILPKTATSQSITEPISSSQCLAPEESNSLQQSVPPESVQQLSTIEQELLQSIQAVSLHCGEPESQGVESHNVQTVANSVRKVLTNPIPPFIHHHSSEESLFPCDEDNLLRSGYNRKVSNLDLQSSTASSLSQSETDLIAQIVDVGLDDDRAPTVLEIENLADHFNSSLLTNTVPITLAIELGDLHLPSNDHCEPETPSTASSISEDNHILSSSIDFSKYTEDDDEPCSPVVQRKKKLADDARLTRVYKKHKKEKFTGRFGVERFSNSDKDIEYYTGFLSYKNFEAFFRSLEAYVERLRVTDVMFGVTNLDKLQSDSGESSSPLHSKSTGEFLSPLPPPPALDEPQKRRPFHGRSMSRIDELFMTVIRLKRKLPEKVLGHMFCISQPTVSRIIRAWTVLLSKLIDCYPVENSSEKAKSSKGGKSSGEHSYTSRGLGIPESFKQLFHCDLAKSIVVTSVSAKDKKISNTARSPVPSVNTKRCKKSRMESASDPDTAQITTSVIKEECSNLSSAETITSDVTSFRVEGLVDDDDNSSSNATSGLIFNLNASLDNEGSEFFQSLDFL